MELSIDTASELASIALSHQGRLLSEMTWRCRRNHTVELLPAIDSLLAKMGAAKDAIEAIFVSTGPGMYTGLRVGIATAKGMACALGIRVAGVGRLELDAYPHAAFQGEIVAVHKAGRGELAWAKYHGDPWRTTKPPSLAQPDELAEQANGPLLFVGEIDEGLAEMLRDKPTAVIASPSASLRRAGTLAEIGYSRMAEGQALDPALLLPIYLRPPAIGPQGPKKAP